MTDEELKRLLVEARALERAVCEREHGEKALKFAEQIHKDAIEVAARVCDRWAFANREAFPEQALAGESCAALIRELGKT